MLSPWEQQNDDFDKDFCIENKKEDSENVLKKSKNFKQRCKK